MFYLSSITPLVKAPKNLPTLGALQGKGLTAVAGRLLPSKFSSVLSSLDMKSFVKTFFHRLICSVENEEDDLRNTDFRESNGIYS